MELLISSNICRYAEFRALDKIVTLIDGNAMAVPCSRADVFTNKTVNVVEKRLLMKTLTDCLNGDDDLFKDFAGKTFRQYLESKRLTPNLIHYILYAIAMCDDDTPCDTGTRRTKQFLQSLGRYGNTPFLFPMYGCGEIPQCFCRLCAVFGGVYCLKRSVENIQIDDEQNEFRSINCNGQTIQAKALVLGNGGRIGGDDTATNIPFVPNDNVETIPMAEDKCGQLARAIYIVNKPLGDESLNSGGGGVNLIRLPAIDASNGGAFVIQLAHHSGTCPKDLCKCSSNPFGCRRLSKSHLFIFLCQTQQIWFTSHAKQLDHCPHKIFNRSNVNCSTRQTRIQFCGRHTAASRRVSNASNARIRAAATFTLHAVRSVNWTTMNRFDRPKQCSTKSIRMKSFYRVHQIPKKLLLKVMQHQTHTIRVSLL